MVDPPLARFSAWYEFFPRSCSPEPGKHGTLRDCEARLRYAAQMGFDIVYVPPIHPIGTDQAQGPEQHARPRTRRDRAAPGRSAARRADTRRSIRNWGRWRTFAISCAPRATQNSKSRSTSHSNRRPIIRTCKRIRSGFVIVPTAACSMRRIRRRSIRTSIRSTSSRRSGASCGRSSPTCSASGSAKASSIFRVDNPHTKPFAFWEWAIGELKREHPELIFLAEAFTRPKVMHRLAKLGFTQSYTYFAWRNTKYEITQYFTELTQGEGREYFRPNCWPNTPDILTEYLQFGGRPAFLARAGARRDAERQLRDLRTGLRADGARAARAGQRGIPGLGEVRAAPLGRRARRQPARFHHTR